MRGVVLRHLDARTVEVRAYIFSWSPRSPLGTDGTGDIVDEFDTQACQESATMFGYFERGGLLHGIGVHKPVTGQLFTVSGFDEFGYGAGVLTELLLELGDVA